MCVCVVFPFILDIKFVERTSRGHTGGRSHRISHPPSFCGACLNFSREKDSAIPFPRRPWTSSLPSRLRSLRIFPSLPGSRLTIFYRDASSAPLQLVNQWLDFTLSRSNAFRYERKNTNPTLVRIELTTSALLAGVQDTYYYRPLGRQM